MNIHYRNIHYFAAEGDLVAVERLLARPQAEVDERCREFFVFFGSLAGKRMSVTPKINGTAGKNGRPHLMFAGAGAGAGGRGGDGGGGGDAQRDDVIPCSAPPGTRRAAPRCTGRRTEVSWSNCQATVDRVELEQLPSNCGRR